MGDGRQSTHGITIPVSYTVNSRQNDSQRRRDKGALRFFALRVAQRARLRERDSFVMRTGVNENPSILYYQLSERDGRGTKTHKLGHPSATQSSPRGLFRSVCRTACGTPSGPRCLYHPALAYDGQE